MIVDEFVTLLGVETKPGAITEVNKMSTAFGTLMNLLKAAAPIYLAMKTFDFAMPFANAANAMRNLGMSMNVPLDRMDRIGRAFKAAGIDAAGMNTRIRDLRFNLTDSWGYMNETAFRWGLGVSDKDTDDDIADRIAKKSAKMSINKRNRMFKDLGISDPNEQRWYYDSKYRKEMKDDAKRPHEFTKEQLDLLADADKKYRQLSVHVEAAGQAFSIGLSPGLHKFFDEMKSVMKSDEMSQFAQGLGELGSAALKNIVELGKAIRDMVQSDAWREVVNMIKTPFDFFGKSTQNTKAEAAAVVDEETQYDYSQGVPLEGPKAEPIYSDADVGDGEKKPFDLGDIFTSIGEWMDERRAARKAELGEENKNILTPLGAAGDMAQASTAKVQAPITIGRQVNDNNNSINIATYNAAPGESFEDAVEDLKFKNQPDPMRGVF
jgi:hypothetical protein